MLVQRCSLDQHRLIVPVSITRPSFTDGGFASGYSTSQYRALVDTGAQRTVLSRTVISEQNLVRIGHMQFAGIHGPKTHSRYMANIAFWAIRVDSEHKQSWIDGAEQTLFSIEEPFQMVDMDDNLNFDVILGFDVLKRFSFHFDAGAQSFQIQIS